MTSASTTHIPVTRAGVLCLYHHGFEAMGAPVQKLLEQAAIPPGNLDIPDAVIPLRNAYRFAELACSSLQSEHLGLYIGLESSLDNYGVYGRNLQSALTVGAYLQKGIDHFNLINSGERFWMSAHGAELRFNIASAESCTLGSYQSHLCTLVMTVANLRRAAGPQWWPREIGLAYASPESLPAVELFAHARVVQGLEHSYITLPRALMRRRFPGHAGAEVVGMEAMADPLPTDFPGLVMSQLDALSGDSRELHIDRIAESLGMSRRTLQRAIGREGLTYLGLVNEYRLRKARDWLNRSEKPVTEIALDLGYTDASNFSRAFRRHTGLTPTEYRALDERPDSTYSPLK
jgi:AraC-like DNA-binding protein